MSALSVNQPNTLSGAPVDWNTLGLRIVEAAQKAAALHADTAPAWILSAEQSYLLQHDQDGEQQEGA